MSTEEIPATTRQRIGWLDARDHLFGALSARAQRTVEAAIINRDDLDRAAMTLGVTRSAVCSAVRDACLRIAAAEREATAVTVRCAAPREESVEGPSAGQIAAAWHRVDSAIDQLVLAVAEVDRGLASAISAGKDGLRVPAARALEQARRVEPRQRRNVQELRVPTSGSNGVSL